MPNQKKKRGAQQPRFCWKEDDVIKVLAFLNHCLKVGLDFESSVASHLAKVIGQELSNKQIFDKLKREWDGYGPNAADSKFSDLLRKGPSVLHGYGVEWQERISEVASHIEPPQVSRDRPRSASPALTSRSRTLSKPRQGSESSESTLSIHATPEFEGFQFDIGKTEHADVSVVDEGLEVIMNPPFRQL